MPTSPPNDVAMPRGCARPAPRRRARSARCRSRRRPWRSRAAPSFSPISPSSRTVSANTSLPPRRTRQRSTNSPCRMRSPIAARPNTTISQSRSEALSARSISMRRDIRARSNRMVSCGSQARCAPAATFKRDVELGGRARRAIDLFRRRRGQRQPRAFAGRDLDIEAIAAGDAAGRVDEHRRQPLAFRRGKAHAQRAGFMQGAAARDAVAELHVEARPRRGRGWPQTSQMRSKRSVRIRPLGSAASCRLHRRSTAPSGG